VVLEGCATQQNQAVPSLGADGGVETAPPSAGASAGTAERSGTTSVPPARVGTPAASQRIRFVPDEVVLPGGARAPVVPASTAGGQLVVPEKVRRVGWWDGGAEAGDPFGSVVLAGHVDSAQDGIGFFVRLRRVRVGETVVLRGEGHAASYRVGSVRSVPKNALATESGAFDQHGPHRLVLITCTGAYDAARGGYEENLVVTAAAVGSAQ
jgi:LPXTG-site transpeptidase (sortase) family protein